MTVPELVTILNGKYGLNLWPPTYEVDAETYANCCQAIFNQAEEDMVAEEYQRIKIYVGNMQRGLMFKNVELILR